MTTASAPHLYSMYKQYSVDVFRPVYKVLTKIELIRLAKQYRQCVEYRIAFAKICALDIDEGHQRVIDAAQLKSEAFYIAALPHRIFQIYGEKLALAYNKVVENYNTTKRIYGDEYYLRIVGNIGVPPLLVDNCVRYATRVCRDFFRSKNLTNTVQHLERKHLDTKMIWTLMGFGLDPLVRNVYLSVERSPAVPRKSPPRSPPRDSPPRNSPPRNSPPRNSPPRNSPPRNSPPTKSPPRDPPPRNRFPPRTSSLPNRFPTRTSSFPNAQFSRGPSANPRDPVSYERANLGFSRLDAPANLQSEAIC
jgi:hypothetical protein